VFDELIRVSLWNGKSCGLSIIIEAENKFICLNLPKKATKITLIAGVRAIFHIVSVRRQVGLVFWIGSHGATSGLLLKN
jgi:hypothetical protein